jgi:hypothetical protein
VSRFSDETPESHATVRLYSPTDARTEPSDAGELVADLPVGASVTRLALRGRAVLVEFDDPEDPLKRLVGWIPGEATPQRRAALTPATFAVIPPDTGKRSRTWYGWQTLTTDGITATVVAVSLFTLSGGNRSLFLAELGVGAAIYALGAPIVHWAHGNAGTGFGSLAMRLPCGVIAYFSALALAYLPVTAVGLAGVLVPVVVDAAALAYDTAPAAPPKTQMWLMPTVAPTKGGATFGLAGGF